MNKPTKSALINAMKADALPGACICCDMPLPERARPNGPARVICKDPECAKLYAQVYSIDKRRGYKC